jgi:PhzF family phenazine biosynthesis protein
MTDIPFYWLDIFTESKFKGNPAAVCVHDEELDDETYQNIAKELNLSETAFPIKVGPSEYNLRWFSPAMEMPLCGHATVATAYTLNKEYNEKTPILFHTLSGDHVVEINDNKVTLNFPKWSLDASSNPELCKLVGLSPNLPIFYNQEMQSYVLILDSAKQVEDFSPDFQSLLLYGKQNDVYGLVVASEDEGEYDYVYRVFAPVMGVNEDAGTGIANCVLGHHWGKVLGKKQMWVGQLSERGSEFEIEVVRDGVKITGKATPLIKGTISI